MTGLLLALILWAGAPASDAPAAPAATPIVVINEILAHTDLPQQDAIELYNPTDAAIDISAWILADNSKAEQRIVIPSGAILAPGAYWVVTLNENSPFRLSEFGETVYLYLPGAGDAPGPLVDRAAFGVSPNGVSFGRISLSTGEVRMVLSQDVTLWDANGPPRVGPLVIDEIMYRPAADDDEFVAIRNNSSAYAPLCDVGGSELPAILRAGDNDAFTFPCNDTWLGPGQRLFVADTTPAAFRSRYGLDEEVLVFGPFAGRLSNEGELVEIAWPQPPETDGTVAYYPLDQVDYTAAAPWPVLATAGLALHRLAPGAFGDDPANWRPGVASPLEQRVWLPVVGK